MVFLATVLYNWQFATSLVNVRTLLLFVLMFDFSFSFFPSFPEYGCFKLLSKVNNVVKNWFRTLLENDLLSSVCSNVFVIVSQILPFLQVLSNTLCPIPMSGIQTSNHIHRYFHSWFWFGYRRPFSFFSHFSLLSLVLEQCRVMFDNRLKREGIETGENHSLRPMIISWFLIIS